MRPGLFVLALVVAACQAPAPARPTPPVAPPAPTATAVTAPSGPARISAPVDPLRTFFGIDEGIRNDPVLAATGATWQRLVISWTAVQPTGPGDSSRLPHLETEAGMPGIYYLTIEVAVVNGLSHRLELALVLE